MSNFIVSARKYRPTTFDEVIGQDHIAKTLKNALSNDQLAHSFLFCGPRGVGKTTCARILAKVINCENPINNVEPCNECASCKSFNDNASFNIIELDAASNNSVEHMRTLIEQVRFQPQHGSHKIFIIDEVHMLTTQAFNAFLKTLEEPPSYAIFILATTEKHKILPTILSRCQIFDFKRIQPSDVVTQLDHILQQEGKKADQEALHLIGQKADGAMRDALSIYDKIASATGDHISYKDVIYNLNILDYDYYFKAVDAFIRSDISEVFNLLNTVIKQGFEVDQFVQGLANHIRDLLVCKDERTINLLEVSDRLKERYLNQARLINSGHLLTALDILNQCDFMLARANNKRLYVEIALSKITLAGHMESVTIGSGEGEKKKLVPPEEKKSETTINENVTASTHPVKPIPKASPNAEKERPKETKESISVEPSTKQIKIKVEQPKSSAESPPTSSALLNLDIHNITEEIKKAEQDKKSAEQNLSLENIRDFWDEYSARTSSPSVKTALSNTILTFKDSVVKVIIPSLVTQNIIKEENNMLELMRKEFGTEKLKLEFLIDKDQFPDYEENKPKEVLTDREKYQKMVEKNASLRLFVEKLDLKKNNRAK